MQIPKKHFQANPVHMSVAGYKELSISNLAHTVTERDSHTHLIKQLVGEV